MTRALRAVMCIVLLTQSAPALAQATSSEQSLLSRADSITVGDYCQVAETVTGSAALRRAMAEDSVAARVSTAVICDPLLRDFSLRALRGDRPAPLAAIARLHDGQRASPRPAVFDAMDSFRAAARSPDVRDALRRLADSADSATLRTLNTQLVRVTETAHALLLLGARDAALDRLARYERKLGPTSARLNAPETLLNYAAQRWVPGFAPRALAGPSPLEIVASYVPTYATYADRKPVAVSASEFGIRWYLFGERFGADGVRGLLFPTYWSAGALTVSDRNGALVWPWDGRTRTGAFVSWGAIKVGYVNGRRGEWIFSKQTQIIPFVF